MKTTLWLTSIGCLIVVAIVARAVYGPATHRSSDSESPLYNTLLTTSLDRFKNSELVASPTPAHARVTPLPQPLPHPVATPPPVYRPAPTPAMAVTTGTVAAKNAIEQGRLAFAAKQWEAALTFYDYAIAVNEKDYLVHSLRGDALLRLDRLEDALKSYKRSFELNPSFTFALHGVATACIGLERYNEAIEAYMKILSLDSGDETARQMLAKVQSLLAGTPKQ